MRVCNNCRETLFGNPDVCPKCHRSLATIKEEKNVEEKPLYELRNSNGRVLAIYSDRVTLMQNAGLKYLSLGTAGKKTIYISDITSIQYKSPTSLGGFMQFTIPGGKQFSGGIMEAGKDENAIVFSVYEKVISEKIYDYLHKRIHEIKSGEPTKAILSPMDEIRKLKALLDEGIITVEEFEAKKKNLLDI